MTKPVGTYIAAAIFPFWTMILSIVKFDSKNSKLLFWYGCAFMGIIFIYNPLGGTTNDSIRVAQGLVEMHNQPVTVSTLFQNYWRENGDLDLYQTIVTYFVSWFTGNPHILFLVMAIVFGYFYTENIWYVFSQLYRSKLNWTVWIIIVALLLANPIWNINGGRMWVALHVFIYGIYGYFIQGKKQKLIWSFASVFFHFSFILPLLVLFIYFIMPKSGLVVYYILFLATALTIDLDIPYVRDFLINHLPTALYSKTIAYLDDDYMLFISDMKKDYSTYIHISNYMSMVYKYLISTSIFIILRKCKPENIIYKPFIFYLLLSSVINVISSIPSAGRFYIICNFMLISLVIILISTNLLEKRLNVLVQYAGLLLVLPVLFTLRIGAEFYGSSLFWGNFIQALVYEDNTPLIQFIKHFIS